MRAEGQYCGVGDFYIAPSRRVGRAIITHGHTAHLRKGHKCYLISEASERILVHRLGSRVKYQTLAFGAELVVNGVRVSLHPAAHILGSAQVRLEWRCYTVVVTGDCKLEADESCEVAEIVQCDQLVAESTFALPVYAWQEQSQVFDEMARWCVRCIERRVRPVLLCYSLGKAERVMVGLRALAPLHVDAVLAFAEIYASQRVAMPATCPIDRTLRPAILPPGGEAWRANHGPFQASIGPWARWPGFALSDHVDWPGLNELVAGSGAETFSLVHGFSAEAAR